MKSLSWGALVCALVLLSTCSYAVELKSGNSVDYPKGSAVTDDILAAGNQVSVDPEVKGDVTAVGQDISISGSIKDSVTIAGNSVTVSGPVGNDVWMAGQSVTLAAPVTDNAFLAGSSVKLTDRASVGTDLLAAGNNLTLMGNVGRNMRVAGNDITIGGTVRGNVYAHSNNTIRIIDGAVINGNLFYESPQKASIAPGAKILGRTEHSLPAKEKAKPVFWSKFMFWLGSLIASILFGIVFIALFPVYSQQTANTIKHSFWVSLGIGFVTLIVVPITCFIIALTILGIPVALALFALYMVLLYAARIPVAIAIGQLLLGRGRESLPNQFGSMILGLVILYLIGMIPFLGSLVKLVVAAVGLGAFAISYWKLRKSREVTIGAS